MNLKKKFLIIFLLISNIPILVITLFTYDRYTRLVEAQTTQVSDSVFSNAVKEADSAIENIDYIFEIFHFYSEDTYSIVNDLKKYIRDDGSYDSYDLFKSRQNMKFICQNLIYSNDYINGIFVFTPSGENIGYGYGENIDIQYGYTPFEDSWYLNTLAKKGGMEISEISEKDYILNGKPSITFSRSIYDVLTHEFLGVLMVDCTPGVFDLSGINTLPDTALLVVEKDDGAILYSNIDDMKGDFSSSNTRIMRNPLKLDGITLVAAINFHKLYEEFGVTRIVIVVIALVCAGLFIIISIFLSHYLTKPIAQLSRKMAARKGHKPETLERYLNRTDEIGILYNEYNNMIMELGRFIKKEYENKLITLDSQMKSLEAQINSHFLYNTLESINSIAQIEEVESISVMSLALGNMFRYSIKTKSELVSVKEELQHVHNYISIQKIRFEDKFHLIIDISTDMYRRKVLKLILQPIVENALYHGLQYCNCGSSINIRGYADNVFLYFEISDDGKGMTPQNLAALRAKLSEESHFTELGQRNKESIGLKNIHTRIELYYGRGYGLSIQSSEGCGTSITIKLPLLD